MVFDTLLHQNKVKNKIQDHIRIPREKAHRTILKSTAALTKVYSIFSDNPQCKIALYCRIMDDL